MSPVQATAPPDPLVQLRIERRSFVIGTLLIWAVILTTMALLFVSFEPQVFSGPPAQNFQQALARTSNLKPLTGEQQLLFDIIFLVGGIALFFLNWRFSFLLQRPRSAFLIEPGRIAPRRRWLWWSALMLNSLFYASLLFPQLIVTVLLARWGTQEIRRRSAQLAPPSHPEAH